MIFCYRWGNNERALVADKNQCINCQTCARNCPMSLDVNSMVQNESMENSECILCGTCADNCPKNAIKLSFGTEKSQDKVGARNV